METIFFHTRKMSDDGNGGRVQTSKWAVTTAVRKHNGVYIGFMAFCNPKDQFSRKIGRDIAEGRLIKHINQGVGTPVYFKVSDEDRVVDHIRMQLDAAIYCVMEYEFGTSEAESISFDLGIIT